MNKNFYETTNFSKRGLTIINQLMSLNNNLKDVDEDTLISFLANIIIDNFNKKMESILAKTKENECIELKSISALGWTNNLTDDNKIEFYGKFYNEKSGMLHFFRITEAIELFSSEQDKEALDFLLEEIYLLKQETKSKKER